MLTFQLRPKKAHKGKNTDKEESITGGSVDNKAAD